MEWQMMNLDGLAALQSHLGFTTSAGYETSSFCSEALQDIIMILKDDDETLRSRQVLATLEIICRDLVPIIKTTDDLEIFENCIELLKMLTDPLESLVSNVNKLQGGIKLDIDRMFTQTRRKCIDTHFLKAVVNMINTSTKESTLLEKDQQILKMVENCLMLLRNLLLLAPDDGTSQKSQSNLLVRLMFETGFDKIILKMVRLNVKGFFCESVSQALTLMFKDHAEKVLSVERTDVCGMKSETRKAENVFDMSEMKVQLAHNTEAVEEIEEKKNDLKLWEHLDGFCKEFIPNGFYPLIQNLLLKKMGKERSTLDDTYLLWIVSYYTKYINCHHTMKTPKELLREPFLSDLCCALVYEAVFNCETLMSLQQKNHWSPSTQRRLHLTVCALYQIFKIIQQDEENERMERVLTDIANMRSLQKLFMLLLNQYKPHLQGVLYLSDIIQTNHIYILLLDNWLKKNYLQPDFTLQNHISMFAKKKIMKTYSYSLACFEYNSSELNDNILTLMHHIAGSVGKMDVLMQLPIVIIFGQIWEKLACQNFSDLLEFVLQSFLSGASDNPDKMSQELFEAAKDSSSSEEGNACEKVDWSDEEEDLLMKFLAEEENSQRTVDDIVTHFWMNGFTKTPIQVAKHICETGCLTDDLIKSVQQIFTQESDDVDYSITADPDTVIQDLIQNIRSKDNEVLQHLQNALLQVARAKTYMVDPVIPFPDPVAYSHLCLKKSVPIILFTEEEEQYLNNKHLIQLLHLLQLNSPRHDSEVYWRIPYEWRVQTLIEMAQKLGPVDEDDVELLEAEGIMEQTSIPGSPKNVEMSSDGEGGNTPKKTRRNVEDVDWLTYVQQLNSMN